MPNIYNDKILILDFGSQYSQLIARRIREIGVYCELLPYDVSSHFIEKFIDRVVEEKPEIIVVQDKQNKNVGCISSKRLSEILKK